jgi:fibronectin type 3 domain-containing protein
LPTGVTKKKSSSTTSLTLSGTPTKAKSYSFTISATDCGGHAVQAAYEVVVQANADHVVDLNWNASSTTDIVGYNVYRGPDGKSWNKINASLAASTTYSDSTVADSSIYYYAATAVDVMGNESDKSNLAKSKVP